MAGTLAGCADEPEFPYLEITQAAAIEGARLLPPPNVPACGATVAQGWVRVRAVQTPIPAASTKRVTVYPFDQSSILVGIKASRASPDNPGDGKLWKVPCDAAAEAKVVFEQEGADFGFGVLGPKRKHVVYTGTDGVYALALRDDQGDPGPHPPALTVTKVPAPDEGCWLQGDPSAKTRSRDIVKGLSEDGKSVRIERWSPCGYGGVWIAKELHKRDLMRTDEPAVAPRPVSSVAVDPRGRVWLGDAGRCDEPGVKDVQTPGVVYVSRDKAESWKAMRVVAESAPMPTAAKVVLADAKRQGSVVVLSAMCKYRAGTTGGQLYFTRSVGAKWGQIPIPDNVGVPVDEGFGVTGVALEDGSIDKLIVWGQDGRAYRTRNGGQSWRPASDAGLPEVSGNQTATVGSFTLRATREGLMRVAADDSATYVFPTPETRVDDDVEATGGNAGTKSEGDSGDSGESP